MEFFYFQRFIHFIPLFVFLIFTKTTFAIAYISPDGSDKNDGSAGKPFATLSRALASKDKEIRFSEGKYYLNLKGSKPISGEINYGNIDISGGWDKNFKNRIGYSEMIGGKRFIFATNVSNLSLKGFRFISFIGGNENAIIQFHHCNNISITDIIAEKNQGSILKMIETNHSNVSLDARDNAKYGPRSYTIWLEDTKNNNYQFNLENNLSGGLYSDGSEGNNYKGIFRGNKEIGGMRILFSLNDRIESVISENNSTNTIGGGAEFRLKEGKNDFFLKGNFSNNSAGNGGGVAIRGSGNKDKLTNGINVEIQTNNNVSYGNGGGLYISGIAKSNFKVHSENNSSTRRGGGIYAEVSIENTFDVKINNNKANFTGGFHHLGSEVKITKNSQISENQQGHPINKWMSSEFQNSKIVGYTKSYIELKSKFENEFKIYGIELEFSGNSDWELNKVEQTLFNLLEALSLFKPEWIKNSLDGDPLIIKVENLNSIRGYSAGYSGIILSYKIRDSKELLEVFLHEWGHQLEYKFLDNEEFPVWNRLNQKNFLYQNNNNYYGNKNKFQGFVSDYASKNISEDVAETFFYGLIYLVKTEINHKNTPKYDPIILKKIQFLKPRISLIFPGIWKDQDYLNNFVELFESM